jgi:uncharacterized protein (DUF697 family)
MSNSDKADTIIKAAVISTAAMGAVPVFFDVAALMVANGAMVGALALTYDVEWSDEETVKLIKRILEACGTTFGAIKLFASGIAFTGVGLPLAIGLNAMANAVVTLGLGRAAQRYFESGCKASDAEVYAIFMNTVSLGGFKEVVKILKKQNKETA